ncbi:MAG TPA: SDR family oxidoreductase [Burkholderiales bacterium]|nr:SDR family oxidoreductase [Burkholderiales bacterium]
MARRCLVLGGSGYIGAEVCRVLLEQGAQVAFTYWRNEIQIPGALALRADLRDFAQTVEAVERAAAHLGGLDVLVQCAGTAGDPALYKGKGIAQERLQKISEAGWDDMMDLTVKGSFSACQAAGRAMDVGSQIVIIGSMDGVKTVPSPAHYAAGKGALRAMVQALAKELGGRGILVNMLAPGILDGGVAKLLSDELLQEYLKHCSLKRTGTAHEVAQFVSWLAMENTYVTGQAIVLDGGL